MDPGNAGLLRRLQPTLLVAMNLNETGKLEKAGTKEAEREELKGVVSSEEQA